MNNRGPVDMDAQQRQEVERAIAIEGRKTLHGHFPTVDEVINAVTAWSRTGNVPEKFTFDALRTFEHIPYVRLQVDAALRQLRNPGGVILPRQPWAQGLPDIVWDALNEEDLVANITTYRGRYQQHRQAQRLPDAIAKKFARVAESLRLGNKAAALAVLQHRFPGIDWKYLERIIPQVGKVTPALTKEEIAAQKAAAQRPAEPKATDGNGRAAPADVIPAPSGNGEAHAANGHAPADAPIPAAAAVAEPAPAEEPVATNAPAVAVAQKEEVPVEQGEATQEAIEARLGDTLIAINDALERENVPYAVRDRLLGLMMTYATALREGVERYGRDAFEAYVDIAPAAEEEVVAVATAVVEPTKDDTETARLKKTYPFLVWAKDAAERQLCIELVREVPAPERGKPVSYTDTQKAAILALCDIMEKYQAAGLVLSFFRAGSIEELQVGTADAGASSETTPEAADAFAFLQGLPADIGTRCRTLLEQANMPKKIPGMKRIVPPETKRNILAVAELMKPFQGGRIVKMLDGFGLVTADLANWRHRDKITQPEESERPWVEPAEGHADTIPAVFKTVLNALEEKEGRECRRIISSPDLFPGRWDGKPLGSARQQTMLMLEQAFATVMGGKELLYAYTGIDRTTLARWREIFGGEPLPEATRLQFGVPDSARSTAIADVPTKLPVSAPAAVPEERPPVHILLRYPFLQSVTDKAKFERCVSILDELSLARPNEGEKHSFRNAQRRAIMELSEILSGFRAGSGFFRHFNLSQTNVSNWKKVDLSDDSDAAKPQEEQPDPEDLPTAEQLARYPFLTPLRGKETIAACLALLDQIVLSPKRDGKKRFVPARTKKAIVDAYERMLTIRKGDAFLKHFDVHPSNVSSWSTEDLAAQIEAEKAENVNEEETPSEDILAKYPYMEDMRGHKQIGECVALAEQIVMPPRVEGKRYILPNALKRTILELFERLSKRNAGLAFLKHIDVSHPAVVNWREADLSDDTESEEEDDSASERDPSAPTELVNQYPFLAKVRGEAVQECKVLLEEITIPRKEKGTRRDLDDGMKKNILALTKILGKFRATHDFLTYHDLDYKNLANWEKALENGDVDESAKQEEGMKGEADEPMARNTAAPRPTVRIPATQRAKPVEVNIVSPFQQSATQSVTDFEKQATDGRSRNERLRIVREALACKGDKSLLGPLYERNNVQPGDVIKWMQVYKELLAQAPAPQAAAGRPSLRMRPTEVRDFVNRILPILQNPFDQLGQWREAGDDQIGGVSDEQRARKKMANAMNDLERSELVTLRTIANTPPERLEEEDMARWHALIARRFGLPNTPVTQNFSRAILAFQRDPSTMENLKKVAMVTFS